METGHFRGISPYSPTPREFQRIMTPTYTSDSDYAGYASPARDFEYVGGRPPVDTPPLPQNYRPLPDDDDEHDGPSTAEIIANQSQDYIDEKLAEYQMTIYQLQECVACTTEPVATMITGIIKSYLERKQNAVTHQRNQIPHVVVRQPQCASGMSESDSSDSSCEEKLNPHEELVVIAAKLKSRDEEIQKQGLKNIKTVADKLGPELTRTELLPIINEFLNEQSYSNDVLLVLVIELEDIISCFTDFSDLDAILGVIDNLAATDETIVRTTAGNILCEISEQFTDEQFETVFFDFLQRQVDKSWFAPKCTAAMLFKPCYPKVSSEKQTYLLDKYLTLCNDDNSMIRQTYVAHLPDFMTVLQEEHIRMDILEMYIKWSKHEMIMIRTLCVELMIPLSRYLSDPEKEENIYYTIKVLATDNAWKIRLDIANKLLSFQEEFAPNESFLLTILKILGNDTENVVKEAIAGIIIKFALFYRDQPKLITKEIAPLLKVLNADSEPIANILAMDVILLVDKNLDKSIIEMATSLIVESIGSEKLDSGCICERSISNFAKIIDITGFKPEFEHKVELLMFKLLSNYQIQWRRRVMLLMIIEVVAKYAKDEYFAKNIVPFYQKLLVDVIFAIRRSAPILLPYLVNSYGIEFAKKHILNKIWYLKNHANYLYRMVILFCLDELVDPSINPPLINIEESEAANIKYLNGLLGDTFQSRWLNEVSTHYVDLTQNEACYYIDVTDMYNMGQSQTKSKSKTSYLQNILMFLLQHGIPILRKLSSDPVANVRMRCSYTIYKIKNLHLSLEALLKNTPTLEESMKNQLDEELTKNEPSMEQEGTYTDHGKVFQRNTISADTKTVIENLRTKIRDKVDIETTFIEECLKVFKELKAEDKLEWLDETKQDLINRLLEFESRMNKSETHVKFPYPFGNFQENYVPSRTALFLDSDSEIIPDPDYECDSIDI